MPDAECRNCDYDLSALLNVGGCATCPECGNEFAPYGQRELRLRALRWNVPLWVGAGSVALALLFIALTLAGLGGEWCTVTVVLAVLSGLTNWVATAVSWMNANPRGMIHNRFQTCLGAWAMGFVAAVLTSAIIGGIAIVHIGISWRSSHGMLIM